jgi:hypothetical protein
VGRSQIGRFSGITFPLVLDRSHGGGMVTDQSAGCDIASRRNDVSDGCAEYTNWSQMCDVALPLMPR